MKRLFLLGVASLALTAAACSSDSSSSSGTEEEGAVPTIDCDKATVPTFAELTFLQTTCAECHSSTKSGADRVLAPANVNYDTYAAAKANATKGVEELYEDPPAMPPEGSDLPAVTDDEKVAFNTWAQCGTPE